MARPLRIEFAGALHHVFSRGNGENAVFLDDDDRRKFVDLLACAVVRFGWILHDWCLLSTHFHLSIETPECTLSRGMHWILTSYVGSFNKRHRKRGHVFGSRFKNVVVEKESYLVTLTRYIALNPVKGGMVTRPEDWAWSSYRARAGLEKAPEWLTLDGVFLQFDPEDEAKAREGYRRFVNEGLGDSSDPFDSLGGKLFLGTAAWIEKMQALIDAQERSEDAPRKQVHPGRPELEHVIEAVAAAFETTGEAIAAERGTLARRVVAYLAFEDGLVTQRKIARALGLTSAGGISGLASRCRRELKTNGRLREIVEDCRKRMRRRPPPFLFPKENPPITARRYHRSPAKSR